MVGFIMKTNDELYQALGHLQQAELLIAAVRAADADTYALCDGHSLTQDAISQIRGELTARTNGDAA